MARRNLPTENQFASEQINGWKLEKEIGRGKIGVVYRATKAIAPNTDVEVAIKLIPDENLKPGWKTEIQKLVKLSGIPQVVQYREHDAVELHDVLYACIVCEYIDGQNLREYARDNPTSITLAFMVNLIDQLLQVFLAMKETGITHDDLHEGNILIAYDRRRYNQSPVIKVGDFGIGGSHNELRPKDDYGQLASICHNLLDKHIDPAALGVDDRAMFNYLAEEFLSKNILETNPTVGNFVRDPRTLLDIFIVAREDLKRKTWEKPPLSLKHPFDYLSCEQIGDSFELLHKLYSSNFPGYEDLLQKANTILTGPRGCGKTTIFRNLSLKTHLLAKTKLLKNLEDYVGIYYYCGDLYFPFHYFRTGVTDLDRRVLTHYFNLALLREILDTLAIAETDPDGACSQQSLTRLEEHLAGWLPSRSKTPQGTSILRHLLSVIDREKNQLGIWLSHGRRGQCPVEPSQADFIPRFCHFLTEIAPWMKDRSVFFFLDDYSLPRISEEMQSTLHDFIMHRWPSCFFKISTESITTFHPYDSAGRLLEETREYDVIDLGAYFMRAEVQRKAFLIEVINNRLSNSENIHDDYQDIAKVLGPRPYESYNELARRIRAKKKRPIYYAGMETVSDLFSGDIADLLRLIRNVFSGLGSYDVFSKPGLRLPIKLVQQNSAIREYGAGFLSRVEAAPNTGGKLRSIAESFGKAANWVLRNRDSKNEQQKPPWQSFRIEVRERFSFDEAEKLRKLYTRLVPEQKRRTWSLEDFRKELLSIYKDILKYGVFLRDHRGKSQRGAVVPRLYLRRLLIPTFLLTPSQRDSIGLEVDEFLTLLYTPQRFLNLVKEKKDWETRQRGLFNEGNL